jgi:hypothetical protein
VNHALHEDAASRGVLPGSAGMAQESGGKWPQDLERCRSGAAEADSLGEETRPHAIRELRRTTG